MECNNRAHVKQDGCRLTGVRILIIVLSNMFAVILLKKRTKYLLEFLKQVQRHVATRILNVDPVYSESDKEYKFL